MANLGSDVDESIKLNFVGNVDIKIIMIWVGFVTVSMQVWSVCAFNFCYFVRKLE